MRNLNETLEDRGAAYGSFSDMAKTAQELKAVLVTGEMTFVEQEAMELICTKLARLAHGNPHHRDSWLDIAGYAQLVVKEIDNESVSAT